MRIIKDANIYHYDDIFYETSTLFGKFISSITSTLPNEKKFISIISTINYWDFPKVSLWTFKDILNFIDDLFEKYQKDINNNKQNLMKIFKFLKLILSNSLNKDIFLLFDKLEFIFLHSNDFEIKIEILEIYNFFIDNTKSVNILFMEFSEYGEILTTFREILMRILKRKKENNFFVVDDEDKQKMKKIIKDLDKQWKKIFEDKNSNINNKKEQINFISGINLFNKIIHEKINLNEFYNKNSNIFNNNNNNNKIKNLYEDFKYFTNCEKTLEIENKTKVNCLYHLKKLEIFYKHLIFNYLLLINEISNNLPSNPNLILNISKYILTLINYYIMYTQKNKKNSVILTEYYIELYLKDVLFILTSNFHSLEIKSIFLENCIIFNNNLSGYESILFQNGFFHSILGDLTHQNKENELLSYNDSLNQNFFKSVLNFLYKISTFKENPVYFLNNVIEVPKNNVYLYRIDNVIYSLKKKTSH